MMKTDMIVYNSLSRQKEKFIPIHKNKVLIYVCGPTVYGEPHLGHAKSYIFFDVLIRWFRYVGYKVLYVQNITDVGHLTDNADAGLDKLQQQALHERKHPMEVADYYYRSYTESMKALNVMPPDISPRATGHIIEQIEMIKKLIDKGYAYEINGNVYFDVLKCAKYGKLSRRTIDKQKEGYRIEKNPEKHHAADFALWKKAEPSHIMRWQSPWGEGYPGWHIECSAMAVKYLGQPFDIHGGGIENLFPHHECEIAQAEGACDKPFANYWIHNNMVTINGVKMGKSLGNAISLAQFFSGSHALLTRSWSAQTIRFLLLQSHYRSVTDFSEKALWAAESGLSSLEKLLNKILSLEDSKGEKMDVKALSHSVHGVMADDINTAKAMGILFDGLRSFIQKAQNKGIENAHEIHTFVTQFLNNVMGIELNKSQNNDIIEREKINDLMQILLDIRNQLRENHHYDLSDLIRDRLSKLNITIQDGDTKSVYSTDLRSKTKT